MKAKLIDAKEWIVDRLIMIVGLPLVCIVIVVFGKYLRDDEDTIDNK